MEKIRVSVIVLQKGTLEELQNTLCSIYEQTETSFQVIVADISMNQECLDWICQEYGSKEDLIYLKSDSLISEGAAVNRAVEASTGEYLAFVDGGASWHKDKLKQQLSYLEALKGKVVWAYHTAEERGSGSCIPASDILHYQKAGYIFPDLIRNHRLINKNTVMIERETYFNLGGMNEELPIWADYEFFLRVARNEQVFFSERALAVVKPVAYAGNLVIAIQALFLEEFSEELDRLGLKEEKMEQVMEFAEEKGQFLLFEEYAESLTSDNTYARCLENYLNKRKGSVRKPEWKKQCVDGLPGCVGCASCADSCPTGAISMEYDAKGFLAPKIDLEKCISCGKCVLACPVLKELPMKRLPKVCYGVQGPKAERENSSSGGVFPLLAKYFLENDGYVAGAVFDKDFYVRHIVSNRPEEIARMQTSKYVQSDTRGVYPRVRELLEQGNKVLFTGCGCQVAGLLAYLPKQYDGLYTLDVVCHGVPSPKIYQKYLEEFTRKAGQIKEVSFRKKSVFGWHSGLYIGFQNGKHYCAKGYDPYMAAFLNDWILRDSCYRCAYKEVRCSDMTLGDFWGIKKLEPAMEDGKGTSLLTLNTLKGMELYRHIKDSFGSAKGFELQRAAAFNPSMLYSASKKEIREILYGKLPGKTLQQAINAVFQSQHFDIGLVLWWSPNYGNALTNYALYQALAKKYSVLPIDNVCMSPEKRFRRFADSYAKCSSEYFPGGSIELIQKCCDAFIVGSDQTWNVYFERMVGCGKYFQLDFADDDKKKISYASSFGMEGAEPPAEEYKDSYRRFDSISVREGFGVDLCRTKYQVEAAQVLDPVFLLEAKEYDALAARASVKEEEPFIFAYLLNPTPEKRRICKEIQKLLNGIKIINVSENSPEKREEYRHILEFDNVKGDIEVEDWIYYMKHCEFVITDSFHGTCFSVIYQKRFLTFVNRQPDRFQIFEKLPGTGNRILRDCKDINPALYLENLDYHRIGEELAKEQSRSLDWLEKALNN